MRWPRLGHAVPVRGSALTRWLGRSAFRLMGWRIRGEWPNEPKLIVVLAPHSSNMDFILSVAVFWGLNLDTHFLAKESLFWFPLGSIMRFLGGIPVNRTNPQGMVTGLSRTFRESRSLVIGITPEGTRGRVQKWHSGFARIAVTADVPVLPAIVNYGERAVYFAPVIKGLATMEAIMAATRDAVDAVGAPRHPR